MLIQDLLEFLWLEFVTEARLFIVISAMAWLGGIVFQRKANASQSKGRAITSNLPLTYLVGVRPKVERVYVGPACLQVLAMIHIVLGSLALWLNNDAVYYAITIVCWGPMIGLLLYLAVKGNRKHKADDSKEPMTAVDQTAKRSDRVDPIRNLIELTEEESETKKKENEAIQEESQADE